MYIYLLVYFLLENWSNKSIQYKYVFFKYADKQTLQNYAF